MTETPLFGGYTDGTIQWRAECLQLVNWGGFDRYHRIDLDPESTLIAGPTGSGKSTLLDAYTALMMPSSVGFNTASNEAGSGRARNPEQRSVLSYLRGKTDVSQDAVGTKTDKVMRGHDGVVWGAVAMTFRSSEDTVFTAARAYVAKPSAMRDPDLVRRRFTIKSSLNLRDLDPLHAHGFERDAVKAEFPGIEVHDSDVHFHDEIFRGLGIAGGERALRLLARVQAGRSVQNVTGLFTGLVLDTPPTYATADRALGHFGDLEKLYDAIATDAAKQQLLSPVKELYERFTTARAAVEQLDTYGVRHDRDQPYDLWAIRYQLRLLTTALKENAAARQEAQTTEQATQELVASRERERNVAEDEFRAGGGDAISRLELQLEQAQSSVKDVRGARAQFESHTSVIGVMPSTAETYAELISTAEPFLADFNRLAGDLENRRFETFHQGKELQHQRSEINAELESLRHRDGLVPMPYDEARRQVAAACDIDPAELPFAAELIDVKPEAEEWRLAAEVTLRGVGLTMLMDASLQAEIRRRIDGLRLGLRLQFEGVELYDHRVEEPLPDCISGRLVFKQGSPFMAWVTRRVAREDHLCVDSPGELGGDGWKVTRNGQTSSGRRGAHGRNRNQTNILGFSNKARRRELTDAIAVLDGQLDELAKAMAELQGEQTKLAAKAAAYRYVGDHKWEQIDLDGAIARVQKLERELEALRDGNERLRALQARRDQAQDACREAIGQHEALKAAIEQLKSDWDQLIRGEDDLTGREAEMSTRTTLPQEVDGALTEALLEAAGSVPRYGNEIEGRLHTLRRNLRTSLTQQQDLADSLAGQITAAFERYLEEWPDPNLTAQIGSYPDFARIYEQIVGAGLYERKEEFKRKVTSWTGNELIQLKVAYDDAVREIRTRLEPINTTLSGLPFGAGRDQLEITMRELPPENVREFRRELTGLTDAITSDLTYESAELRYQRLVSFMDRLRPSGTSASSQREQLLDVRRHIEITARRTDKDGRELSTYTTLDGKSGGESQELIAFISGAALRFQLADDTQSRPRFAPVLLDEGFVKADGEHAGRAVRAWRELGFQLIMAVPLDKVTSLDRHVNLRLSVNKHGDRSSVTELRERRPDDDTSETGA